MTQGSRSRRKQWIPIVALLLSVAIGWSWDHWFREVPLAPQRYWVELDQRDPTAQASLQISLIATSSGKAELPDASDLCPVSITLLAPDGTYSRWYQSKWLKTLWSGVPAVHHEKVDAGMVRTWKILEEDLIPEPTGHEAVPKLPNLKAAAKIWIEPSLVGEGTTAPGSSRAGGIDSE